MPALLAHEHEYVSLRGREADGFPLVNRSALGRNIPLFIAFRVLFNARWYYPVLAVLFLDFGLSIEQYALLNVAWAVAIVGLEVPPERWRIRWVERKWSCSRLC